MIENPSCGWNVSCFENESFSGGEDFVHCWPSGTESILAFHIATSRLFSKVSYLVLMLKPTVSRFLSREVMVLVSSLPWSSDGELNLITPPAVTFCPHSDSVE